MLDVTVRDLAFRHRSGFALRDVTFTFPAGSFTAIVGPQASGASTLLQLIAGTLHPQSGEIILGQRRVTDVKASRRPLLFVTSALEVPGRWSVQHALVAAVRTRKLDRQDRHREYAFVAEKWDLGPLLERRLDSLSSSEEARVRLARIELLRPAIVVADRLLERVNASLRTTLADAFARTMRILGTTVIAAPAARDELAFASHVLVLEDGRVVQHGGVAEVFGEPASEAAAIATGAADTIPITIRGTTVDSVIGSWEIADPPFQGSGVAIVRPADFVPAGAGEDSDVIFGIEEAGFAEGRWIARGMLTGGVKLQIELRPEEKDRKSVV